METVESLQQKLVELTSPGHRGKLLSRGLARGMIWRDGELPADSPDFGPVLSADLLDHGYRLLDTALSLMELNAEPSDTRDRGLRIAGEAIESAVRRGKPTDRSRGFHLACAAGAFHIAHYSARSYCLLQGDLQELNLSSPERTLCLLMKRDLSGLVTECFRWLNDAAHSDEHIASRLSDVKDGFRPDEALFIALASNFLRAIATFEFGLIHGISANVRAAVRRLSAGLTAAADTGHVPMWWITRLAKHLLDDLWKQSLHVRLPRIPPDDHGKWNTLRRNFIDLLSSRNLANIDFWPSQITAADRAINPADDLVVALPTSSGKTRIAELCILRCLADDKRVVYVTPLRALSAQVEISLASTFRPLGFSTTAVYGASGVAVADVDTLRSGSIVVATPEKLDFAIRQDPNVIDDVGLIVLDEGHMIGLSEREIRYETLVQRLLRRGDSPSRRLVCLSAIFSTGPSFDAFTDWIRAGEPGEAIRSTWRPTRQRRGELVWGTSSARLEYSVEGETVFVPRFIEAADPTGRRKKAFPSDKNEFIVAATATFVSEGRSVLIYCPIRVSVETLAQQFLTAHRQDYFSSQLSDSQKSRIADALRVGNEWLGPKHPAVQSLNIGVGVHHGQLPRPFLREVEQLLKERVITVAISSPTLAQGVDLSFEVLIFSSLWRNKKLIPAKEFANAVGRVGRAHVDIDGIYVLPVFESSSAKRSGRISEFRLLDTQAKERQMESGILLLLQYLLNVMAVKLNVSRDEVAEYVLNNQDTWERLLSQDDEHTSWLLAATNELDNAILSTMTDLSTPVKDVASKLDEALRDSYWSKRLAIIGDEERTRQTTLLRSRAEWLWNATKPADRKGYFSAGIGFRAGDIIKNNAEELGNYLLAGEKAVHSNDKDAAAKAAIGIASKLLGVHPFSCELPKRWQDDLASWLSGTATAKFADTAEIAFIQEGIVYYLVWAVESVRTTLAAIDALPIGAEPGNFALCLTYGAPCIPCALLQQAGLASRTLALELVSQLNLTFMTSSELKIWIANVLADKVHPKLTPDDQSEWNRFVRQLRHAARRRWRVTRELFDAMWQGDMPEIGGRVRIRNTNDGSGIAIYSPDLSQIGTIPGVKLRRGGRSIGTIINEDGQVKVRRFGP